MWLPQSSPPSLTPHPACPPTASPLADQDPAVRDTYDPLALPACRSNLRLLARMSGGVSRQWMLIQGPASNRVTLASVASAGAEYVMPSVPSAAAFAGGRAMDDQVFYVNAPITSPWGPGEERTFYAYSNYAGAAAGRIKCVPFRAGNAGVVCSATQNQHAMEAGRVMIKLKNMTPLPLPAWQVSHRFGLQVGP
jgi:hypothetical protein